MSQNVGDRSISDNCHASEAPGHEPGLLESAKLLEHELRSIAYDHLRLAALESRQAGKSLVRIVAMGVITAGLLLTAWLALVGAAAIALVQYTVVSASVALLLVVGAHCLVAVILAGSIRMHSRYLMFPATVSQVKPAPFSEFDPERSR